MTSDPTHSATCPTARRPRLRGWLIVAAASLLVVGGAWPPPAQKTQTAALAAAPIEVRIAQVLARENPSLSEEERERISAAVVAQSARHQLDPELVAAVLLVESGARPWARSPKGARGLMQVMPYMMRPMGLAGNLSTIETNVEAGCMILAGNIRRLGEADGISAYFWGSDIRDGAYLERVRAARERLRESLSS